MATSAISGTNGIGLQDFLKILTSQLSNQDPLKPLDNQEFIAQIAQFSALEQSRQLNEKIDQLLSVQSVNQSVGLLGKTIDFTSSTGSVVSGAVTAINLSSGSALFTIRTSAGVFLNNITLSQINNVR